MEESLASTRAAGSSQQISQATIWTRFIDLMKTFDTPATKLYVGKCIAIVERIISNAFPLPDGGELVGAI